MYNSITLLLLLCCICSFQSWVSFRSRIIGVSLQCFVFCIQKGIQIRLLLDSSLNLAKYHILCDATTGNYGYGRICLHRHLFIIIKCWIQSTLSRFSDIRATSWRLKSVIKAKTLLTGLLWTYISCNSYSWTGIILGIMFWFGSV